MTGTMITGIITSNNPTKLKESTIAAFQSMCDETAVIFYPDEYHDIINELTSLNAAMYEGSHEVPFIIDRIRHILDSIDSQWEELDELYNFDNASIKDNNIPF